jgi:putative endonuclease
MRKVYSIYILTNRKNGTLYIGVTNSLVRRVYEHKHKLYKGFTETYKICKLVYHEEYDYVDEAIAREKQLKKWNREWKIRLIEQTNPKWIDQYPEIGGVEYEKELKFSSSKNY